MGDSTDPCGTPDFRRTFELTLSPILTTCERLQKQLANSLLNGPRNHSRYSFRSSIVGITESNALLASKKRAVTTSLLSKAEKIKSDNFSKSTTVPFPGTKLNCELNNKLCFSRKLVITLAKCFSKIWLIAGKIEIGLQLSICLKEPFLCKGFTTAVFNSWRKQRHYEGKSLQN